MEGQKLSVAEFAAKIKVKYPEYESVEDGELVRRIVSKYPEYADIVQDNPRSEVKVSFQGATLPGFGANVVESGKRFFGDIAQAVAHPVDTAKAVGGLAAGAVEMAIPGEQGQEQNVRALVDFYVDRYGGLENVKKTLYEDPVGALADFATLVGGAGAVFKGAGIAAKSANLSRTASTANRVAEIANTTARVADPLTVPMQAVGAGARAVGGRIQISPRFQNPNPVEADAARWAMNRNIPVDAGAATGNKAVQGAQFLADRSILGSGIGGEARQRAQVALANTGEYLAKQADPTGASVPESAGQAVKAALDKKIKGHKTAADTAYDEFRTIEADPANVKQVQTGTKKVDTGVVDAQGNPIVHDVPIYEKIALPVDVKAIKAKLKPILENMEKWMEPARRNASSGYQAIKSIVNGPDLIQASIAEQGLSGLKALAREARSPEMANVSQGLGKFSARELQTAIDTAAAQAGPKAVAALRRGRAQHLLKMRTDDVLRALREEPVQTFRMLIYSKDAGIAKLRKVAEMAPDAMPKVARAYLEELLSTATAEGGFGHTAKLHSEWRKLGRETKKILFKDPKLVSDLDNFFQVAKMMGENVNPSGSGYVVSLAGQGTAIILHPVSQVPMQIGAAALSKLLHSPKGVKLLTEGLQIPVGPGGNRARAMFHFLRLSNILREQGATPSSE